MRIGKIGTTLPNFGATWSSAIGQYPETDIHVAVIEAAGVYREENGSEGSSVALLDAIADFMGKVDIFKPIVEVWESVRKHPYMPEGWIPIGHELAGNRGIHIPPSYVERKSDGWTEIATIVLSEDLHWGVVWAPKMSPRELSAEECNQRRHEHYLYEPATSSELASLKFVAGGGIWGITNSCVREILLVRDRTEKKLKHLLGMGQTLIMTEQIARAPKEQ